MDKSHYEALSKKANDIREKLFRYKLLELEIDHNAKNAANIEKKSFLLTGNIKITIEDSETVIIVTDDVIADSTIKNPNFVKEIKELCVKYLVEENKALAKDMEDIDCVF